MDTCFLFVKHLDENGCISFTLNSQGELVSPMQKRSFAKIKSLQQDAKTIIVESCEQTTFLDLQLAWLPERKARAAIPFALEDRLAQSVDELHFAFDKARYANGMYMVTVINRQRLEYLMQTLAEHEIKYDLITLDWFALAPNELCICDDNLLVHQQDFKGSLFPELAQTYVKTHSTSPLFTFADSQLELESSSTEKSTYPAYIWIANRLLTSNPLNLCQGALQNETSTSWIKQGYQLAGAVFGVWLLSLIIANGIQLYSINSKTEEIDKQIATIYKSFFPDAKQVISPKFRINQLINANTSNQGHFWYVLNLFAKVLKDKKYTVEQIRYQNKGLSVNLLAPDFASLEALENELKKLQLKVTQTQATTREQQVYATLELK